MDWGRFALAVAVSGVIASFTDWLFMGMLFSARYQESPEIWRQGASERNKIIYSELIGLITCAAFVWLLLATGRQAMVPALKTAIVVWAIGPLPVVFTNCLWIKLSPYVSASHSVGWLARLLITGAVAAWLF